MSRFRQRDKLEWTSEKTAQHQGFLVVDMPENVRQILNMYKRAGDWQHPRTMQRV